MGLFFSNCTWTDSLSLPVWTGLLQSLRRTAVTATGTKQAQLFLFGPHRRCLSPFSMPMQVASAEVAGGTVSDYSTSKCEREHGLNCGHLVAVFWARIRVTGAFLSLPLLHIYCWFLQASNGSYAWGPSRLTHAASSPGDQSILKGR